MKHIILLLSLSIIVNANVCPVGSVVFMADFSITSQWNHYWEECVGSGHALLGLRQDWRDQLRVAHDHLGFKRVRFHGLFDDDMSVYQVINGQKIYSWFNVDSVFDYLLSIGVRPLVELSFMPEDMASGNKTIFHYKGNITPPKSWNEWAELIKQFAVHLIDRYGLEEILQWHFETWNEPNCGFWSGTQEDYFQLLKVTSAALKSVHNSLSVGGPATCQSQWLPETISFAKANNVKLDFISTHEYPTDITPTTRNTMKHVLTKARSQVGTMPLFYTEYNDGLYSPGLHDTIFASAFAIHNVIDCYGLVEIFSWWAFTDVFEEGGFNSEPFQENYGLQTIYGIPKPSFRAFELLHMTGDTRIQVTSSNSTSTVGTFVSKNNTHCMIIVYNHNIPDAPIKKESVCVLLKGTTIQSESQPMLYRIDEDHANPLKKYKEMGQPLYPTQAQITQLMKASELVQERISYKNLPSGEISFQVSLPPEGVAAIIFAF